MLDTFSTASLLFAALGVTILTTGATAAPSVQGSPTVLPEGRPLRVLLIGASIGKGWDFPNLPARAALRGIECDYVGQPAFDKSPAIDRALSSPDTRPDVLILKECSAYFPRDLADSEETVRAWVQQCRSANVTPVLATVVPVVNQKALSIRMKQLVKRILGRPGRNAEIAKYNDWVRQYASAEGLEVLDLEQALRVSDSNRVLRADVAAADGLHLQAAGYELIDGVAAELLRRLARRENS